MGQASQPELSVVVPLYNEELVIHEMYMRLSNILKSCISSYEIILVNDGSTDRTLEISEELCEKDQNVKLICFSRNFGHQIAITAGMDRAKGLATVVIDADLQDPPEVIPEMIKKWKDGYQVVYGVREKRKGESKFKLWTAALFYRTLKRLTSVEIPVDTGDFRLIDQKTLIEFRKMREHARFVRGMISWVGFRQTEIRYVRKKRFAGETKYPFKKMLKFAIDGILSFSQLPLKISSLFGLLASGIGFTFMLYGLLMKFFFPEYVIAGWTSLFVAVLFIGGVQLICIGLLGEYVGRMYEEIKGRPLYIVEKELNF